MKNIKLIKEPLSSDYYFNAAEYQFLIIKQGKEGYSIEARKWDAKRLYQTNVNFTDEVMKLAEVKEAIFYYLLNVAATKALEKLNLTK
jgi:hypothetical protein